MELRLDPEIRGHVERGTGSLVDEFQGVFSRGDD
jgi:hypothetical protein